MKLSALPSTPTLTRPRMKVVSAKPAIPSGTGSAGFQAFSDIALGARLVLVALGSVGLPGPRAGRVATLHKVLLDRTDLRSSCPAPKRAPRTGCNGTPHARSDWSGGRGAWCRRSGARLRVPGGSAHLRVAAGGAHPRVAAGGAHPRVAGEMPPSRRTLVGRSPVHGDALRSGRRLGRASQFSLAEGGDRHPGFRSDQKLGLKVRALSGLGFAHGTGRGRRPRGILGALEPEGSSALEIADVARPRLRGRAAAGPVVALGGVRSPAFARGSAHGARASLLRATSSLWRELLPNR